MIIDRFVVVAVGRGKYETCSHDEESLISYSMSCLEWQHVVQVILLVNINIITTNPLSVVC